MAEAEMKELLAQINVYRMTYKCNVCVYSNLTLFDEMPIYQSDYLMKKNKT